MEWLPIFKTGKYKDTEGRDFEATSEKLDKIVEVDRGREAPITIGHPKVWSPWGTANAFKREGDQVFALPNRLTPEFIEWEKKKLWNKISVSLNPDLTINHIAFLGADPPVVADTPMNFRASTDSSIDFSATTQAALEEVVKGIASASPKPNRIASLGAAPPVVVDTPMNFRANTDSSIDFSATTQAGDLQAQITSEKGKQEILKARLGLLRRDDKAALEEVVNGIASASPKPNR